MHSWYVPISWQNLKESLSWNYGNHIAIIFYLLIEKSPIAPLYLKMLPQNNDHGRHPEFCYIFWFECETNTNSGFCEKLLPIFSNFVSKNFFSVAPGGGNPGLNFTKLNSIINTVFEKTFEKSSKKKTNDLNFIREGAFPCAFCKTENQSALDLHIRTRQSKLKNMGRKKKTLPRWKVKNLV